MIRPVSRLFGLGVVALVAGSGSVVLAQGNTFNPYGNSGYADYREFAHPTYSNDPSLPGQARLQYGAALNRANQFESYVNSLDSNTEPFSQSRGLPSGVPYYQAQRYLNRDRQAYKPNNSDAERSFQEGIRQRNQAYFNATKEKDPRKRALMLQRIERRDVVGRAVAPQAARKPRATPGAAATRRAPAATTPAPNARPIEPAAIEPAAIEPAAVPGPADAPPPINPSTVPIPAPR